MKRHEALIPLSHDHKSTLFLTGQLKFNAPEYTGYPKDLAGKTALLTREYEHHIKEHFRKEEEILFPAVCIKSPQLQQLTTELISEHRNIARLIDLAAKQSSDKILNEIGELLNQHIRKEERQLFELIQQTLSEEELTELGLKIKNN